MLPDKKRLLILIAWVICFSQFAWSQIELGGTPRSFGNRAFLKPDTVIQLLSPDLQAIALEDQLDAGFEKPYRIGVAVNTQLNPSNSGVWDEVGDGGTICRLHLGCRGAVALGIDYSSFHLPAGSDLFIYNPGYEKVAGAFTSSNNTHGHSFSTRPLPGDEIILEYYQPDGSQEKPLIEISGINLIYRGMDIGSERNADNFGGSGPCEVNVNCQEGEAWKPQAKGVVRILTRVNGQSFWCSGSLVNNTRLDFSPIILTANHCSEGPGTVSSPTDLDKWIFYFNYEAPSCAKPASEPVIQSMTGASKLASSQNPVVMGSDFYLLRLNDEIPISYNPFFNGWRTSDVTSATGVGIHHPEGDIKKISTYTQPLTSGTWESPGGTHWLVKWAQTTDGFGVTEAGSSGSPIFDSDGFVIGTLTGGDSGCTSTDGTDYYGKVAFSWESNGTVDSMQLKPWLDPMNLGRSTLNGMSRVVQFEASTEFIPIGEMVDFFDRSYAEASEWHWHFEGGEPSEANVQNPTGIRYASFGKFAVSLRVKYQFGPDVLVDSLTKQDYIQVKALVYPNPTNGKISIFTNSLNNENFRVEVFSPLGKLVKSEEWIEKPDPLVELDLPAYGNLFILRITRGSDVQIEKIAVVRELQH